MTIDVSLIPQNRVENLISKLSEIENNIGNIGTDITNNLVHKNGDETISGVKTFNNAVYCTSYSAYHQNMPGYIVGTTPSSNYYPNMAVLNDSKGQYFGFYGPEMLTDGSYSVRMGVRSQVNSSSYSNLKVGFLSDGSTYTYAPTPPASSNDTQIATTNWCYDPAKSTNLVHRSGNETINGTKTFNGDMFTKNIIPKGYITLGTSTNTWGHMIQFQDTTGKRIARVQPMAIDTTKNRMGIWVNNADNTVEQGIEVWSDGTTYICGNLVKGFVKETWQSETQWYRVWSDGWIEQGGRASLNERSSTAYTLYKPFSDKNYFVTASQYNVSTNDDSEMGIGCSPTSTTRFNAVCHYINPNTMNFMWYACGY